MQTSSFDKSRYRLAALVVLSLGLAACTGRLESSGTRGDDDAPPPPPMGSDAGMQDPDAGEPMQDANTPMRDTGSAAPDTGAAAPDSGTSAPDTGVVDTGTPPVPDDTVPGTTHCEPASNWGDDVATVEYEVLRLVNEARARGEVCGGTPYGPTSPLAMSPELRCAARLHAREMGINGYFDHRGLDGSSSGTRATRAGYSWRAVAENIARYQRTAASVVAGWIDSPGHCRNLMNPTYTDIGVGYWQPDGPYWVQVFGAPR